MILHIFNADNDMALANDEPGYTPPSSIRQMMKQTQLLPTRWAEPGDGVLTDQGVFVVEEKAEKEANWADALKDGGQQSASCQNLSLKGHWLTTEDALPLVREVRPWGWSRAVCHRLRLVGLPDSLLPTDAQLREIRRLSSRERAVEMLGKLVALYPFLAGASAFCTSVDQVEEALQRWPRTILKAPWSGSGKGIRYGQGGREDTLMGYVRRILDQQGGVVVEPFYDKQLDFAMEFWSEPTSSLAFTQKQRPSVTYRGLSIFDTHPNGAYKGNRLWPEEQKRQWLCQKMEQLDMPEQPESSSPQDRLILLQQELEKRLSAMIGPAYRGPLGVDMMVLKDGMIHPCVEINLRMTMGFASLLD